MSNFKNRLKELTRKLPDNIQLPSPEHSWAQVELYRWQYGQLPPQNETCKHLDVRKGLIAMADAIEKNDEKNFPSPMGVMTVLRYVATLVKN